MEQPMISKKELLQRYGISYGALYRWKRKGLIPEEWFMKKSAVTGQETYFPEKLVCQRIDLILENKDELSLDELAEKLREKAPQETLVLKTVFGEQSYLLREIQEMYYEDDGGKRMSVLQEVLQLCHEAKAGDGPEVTTEAESGTEEESGTTAAEPVCEEETGTTTEEDREDTTADESAEPREAETTQEETATQDTESASEEMGSEDIEADSKEGTTMEGNT